MPNLATPMGRTILAGFQRASSSPAAPGYAAPTLTWTSDLTQAYPKGDIYLDEAVIAGDVIQSQFQTAGGYWSSPVSDINHTIFWRVDE